MHFRNPKAFIVSH